MLTGDAPAGEAYFNGDGGCRECHSPTADLKGSAPASIRRGCSSGSCSAAADAVRAGPGSARRRARGHADDRHGDGPSGATVTGVLVSLDDFTVACATRTASTTRGSGRPTSTW